MASVLIVGMMSPGEQAPYPGTGFAVIRPPSPPATAMNDPTAPTTPASDPRPSETPDSLPFMATCLLFIAIGGLHGLARLGAKLLRYRTGQPQAGREPRRTA